MQTITLTEQSATVAPPAMRREHQPRDRATTCFHCGRGNVWTTHRVCEPCLRMGKQLPYGTCDCDEAALIGAGR